MKYIILAPKKEKVVKVQFDDVKVKSDGTKLTVIKKMDLSPFDVYKDTKTNELYFCKKGTTEVMEVLVPE